MDGDYKFIWVDVGSNRPSLDAQIFEDCKLKRVIDQDVIGLPPADHLPDDDKDTPYCFVVDDAFPLWTYMMKPFFFSSNFRIIFGRGVEFMNTKIFIYLYL